jgi:hypothetical protein
MIDRLNPQEAFDYLWRKTNGIAGDKSFVPGSPSYTPNETNFLHHGMTNSLYQLGLNNAAFLVDEAVTAMSLEERNRVERKPMDEFGFPQGHQNLFRDLRDDVEIVGTFRRDLTPDLNLDLSEEAVNGVDEYLFKVFRLNSALGSLACTKKDGLPVTSRREIILEAVLIGLGERDLNRIFSATASRGRFLKHYVARKRKLMERKERKPLNFLQVFEVDTLNDRIVDIFPSLEARNMTHFM